MSDQNNQQDDLTKIKGIGAVRQKWLGETLNIFTFAELATHSVEQIIEQYKAHGKVVSQNEVESWVNQAKNLAPSFISETKASPAIKSSPKNVKIQPSKSLSSKEPVWKPVASFVVEFQTRNEGGVTVERRTAVTHMEADNSKSWPGIEQEQLCQWMRQQANISVVDNKPLVHSTAVKSKSLKLTATQIRLSQASKISATVPFDEKRPFLGHATHKKPINLEVFFDYNNDNTHHSSYAFNAQCYLRNRLSGEDAQMIDMKAKDVVENEAKCNFSLTNLLLEPGMYDLGIFVSGETSFSADYFELPKLNVL